MSGDTVEPTVVAEEWAIAAQMDSTGYTLIARTFLYFDMSSIPAGVDIIAAKLKFFGYEAKRDYICVQQGLQGNDLQLNDFGRFTGPLLAAPIKYVDYSYSSDWGLIPNEFDFNADGIAYLNSVKGGTAKLVIREYEHDYLNTQPPAGAGHYTNGSYFSEAGGDLIPFLEIAYK